MGSRGRERKWGEGWEDVTVVKKESILEVTGKSGWDGNGRD